MLRVTLIRCANGVVVWRKVRVGDLAHAWECTRDNFQVAIPDTNTGLEQFLLGVAQHSTQLAGAISQVVQIEV